MPILGVIENMSYLTCPDCGKRIEVFHHSSRRWAIRDTELELLAEIPMDPGISRAIDAGHPLLQEEPQGQETAIFGRLADRLTVLLDSI